MTDTNTNTAPDTQAAESPFGPPIRYITTHDPATGKSVFTTALPTEVPGFSMPGLAIFDAYKTLTSPVSLNDEADLAALQPQPPSTSSSHPPPPNTTTTATPSSLPNPNNTTTTPTEPAIWFPTSHPHTQTLLRYCDFPPGASSPLHRTETLDMGVVVAGQAEVRLDSGEARTLRVGDSIIQRGTMHAWRNVSEREWVRLVVFLVGVDEVRVGG
ncbi:hypothetical protein CHGG_06782 [Chaetomium globosum CBS 148.51]|uniref:Cupin type-2 domain-containing protein n=1 Tax=Chaetomium globosum (strain ATCC 6205 / CBS 148.51 / DSM 1962 / NBRC 6347 / NRRL 1970) TaxID=306901 RepID=Q2H3I3_CHAGB|nr:uncharacterized protein CHGG_06782 [Chaetomium globosum CBS 148.51]EAQ90163.1 hypothetical protein CHGG_06782 [Chaetomium globosum CBS 148.51]